MVISPGSAAPMSRYNWPRNDSFSEACRLRLNAWFSIVPLKPSNSGNGIADAKNIREVSDEDENRRTI